MMSAELAMSAALAQRQMLVAAPAPSSLMERVRFDMALAAADFNYRAAIRQQELRVYELASYASVEGQVIPLAAEIRLACRYRMRSRACTRFTRSPASTSTT